MQVLIREVRGSFLDEPCPKVRLTWDICGFIEPPILNCLMGAGAGAGGMGFCLPVFTIT